VCGFRWPSWSAAKTREAQRAILEAVPAAQQVCPNANCRHRNPAWAKYCARCGMALYLVQERAARLRKARRAWFVLLIIIVAALAVLFFRS
jgi:hypothetical protein